MRINRDKSGKPIVSKGYQLFNVPATPEGRAFLKQAQKYMNPAMFKDMRPCGRGASRKHASPSLPLSKAAWIALYFDSRDDRKFSNEEIRCKNMAIADRDRMIAELQGAIQSLRKSNPVVVTIKGDNVQVIQS